MREPEWRFTPNLKSTSTVATRLRWSLSRSKENRSHENRNLIAYNYHLYHARPMSSLAPPKSRRVLFLGLALYLTFCLSRQLLPPSIFRDSFPSFTFILVALPLVDLVHGFTTRRRSRWSESLPNIVVACLMASVMFEIVAPNIRDDATGDYNDVIAMYLGGVMYFCLTNQPLDKRGCQSC